MENVADSLKIAFAVMMLVLALTLTFRMISQAKETADTVFFVSDESNYYDMTSIKNYGNLEDGYRVVGVDTVISNLYRIYDESLVIKINSDTKRNTYSSDSWKTRKEAFAEIGKISKDLTGSYIEKCQEIKVSGIYKQADDGSELTITPGATKMYITYTKKET